MSANPSQLSLLTETRVREAILTIMALLLVLAAGCDETDKPVETTRAPSPSPAAANRQTSHPAVLKTRSETREFGSWIATCSNAGMCWAFGYAPEFEAGWIRIALQAGADARPDVRFGFWPDSDVDAPSTLTLRIDGVTFPASLAAGSAEDSPVGVIDNDVRRVIDAVVRGRSIVLDGGATQAISPDGAAAALLWIDEMHGRVGTATALVRRGDKPLSSIPEAPPPSVVKTAAAIDQAGFGRENQQLPDAVRRLPAVVACIEDFSTPAVGDMIMSARLDAQTELWAVPCGAGAYNVTHLWYFTGQGGRHPRPAGLVGTRPAEGVDNTTVNGEYDPRTRLLSAFAQGRGIGDCGVMQTWAWAGSNFLLIEERVMTRCAGVPADLWPVSWTLRSG